MGDKKEKKSKNIGFQIVDFKEVNFEIRDFDYFNETYLNGEEFNQENTAIDFKFDLHSLDLVESEVELFFHIQMLYSYFDDNKKEELFSIFHGDYISKYKMKDVSSATKTFKGMDGIDIDLMILLVSVSYSTVRGYLLARNQGNKISSFPIPIVKPESLFEGKEKHIKGNYYYLN